MNSGRIPDVGQMQVKSFLEEATLNGGFKKVPTDKALPNMLIIKKKTKHVHLQRLIARCKLFKKCLTCLSRGEDINNPREETTKSHKGSSEISESGK